MNAEGKPKEQAEEKKGEGETVIPKKKRKTEPEVTIAPNGPGPDVSVE